MQLNKKYQGFTLIELLVVIAIIGVLVSILGASFSAARTDARNKVMRAEIKETQLALELYKAQNDNYPATLSTLVPEFISEVISAADSANASCNIRYAAPGGTQYKITAVECLVNGTVSADDELARCPSSCSTCDSQTNFTARPDFANSLAVYSAGQECM